MRIAGRTASTLTLANYAEQAVCSGWFIGQASSFGGVVVIILVLML
jgi:hypothetical protein